MKTTAERRKALCAARADTGKFVVERIPDDRLRLSLQDADGSVSDIYEGPLSFILDHLVARTDPTGTYGVRKVRPCA
jgi:hypothetical protein